MTGLPARYCGRPLRLKQPGLPREFASPTEHRLHLAATAVPHSFLRQTLLFLHALVTNAVWWPDRHTVTYLWIDASHDQGRGDLR